MTKKPLEQYHLNLSQLDAELKQLYKKRNAISGFRLLVVIITGIVADVAFHNVPLTGWITLAIGLVIFLYLIAQYVNTRNIINNKELLLQINKDEIDYLEGNYYHQFAGEEFQPDDHPYANDMDVFGKASLFQYINRCTSAQGQGMLAGNFLQSVSKDEILSRQAAVKELAYKQYWRQQLQAYGNKAALQLKTQKDILGWLFSPAVIKDYWKYIAWIFTLAAFALTLLAILEIIPVSAYGPVMLGFTVLSFYFGRRATSVHAQLSNIVEEVETVFQQIKHIEKESFKNIILQQQQQKLKTTAGTSAATEIKGLTGILNRFDARLNMVAIFFLNTFLLWDVRQMLSLEKWKNRNSATVEEWFRTIAETEVLSSLANLSFNHPTWCFPQLSDGYFTLITKDIAHPLLKEDVAVANSFGIEGIGKVALITGSNMAGKSTFLRSLGTNIILAHMGAAVCASSFTTSYTKLMSSMRIADNLAENTSTFYAELKKLETIIKAVNNHERVFILLDEILRGTNSLDKHTGSKAMIIQLIKEQAVAVLATHDVELSELEITYPNGLFNYHFDVQVSNDELYFDYKLKNGVCQNLNASLLMKKIGIEL